MILYSFFVADLVKKIIVYFWAKLCYNIASTRRVGSPGRLARKLRLASNPHIQPKNLQAFVPSDGDSGP